MSESVYDVLIIGAGLTGLSLAHNLTKGGSDLSFAMLEARDRLGGRIHTFTTPEGTKVEMGATWYFPHFNELLKLLKELKIDLVEQYAKGSTFYESDPNSTPRKINSSDDGMYRLKGGTSRLVDTLADRVGREKIHLGKIVKTIRHVAAENLIEVQTRGGETFRGRRVVTTIPPQLLISSVEFQPPLPSSLTSVAANTHTWMGDSMKGAVTYSRPFWKEENLSGALYSNSGPFVQMYDQSSNTGENKFALVGFMDGINKMPLDERKSRTLRQLEHVFGRDAAQCLTYVDTDWKEEEFTMPKSAPRLFRHKNNGHAAFQEAYYGDRLFIGGTETSPHTGGYMEGAVHSAKSLYKQISRK